VEQIQALGIPVASLDCSDRRALLPGVRRLWTFLKRERPDLVHTHLLAANVVGRIAGRLAGVPVVSSVHGVDYAPETCLDPSFRGRATMRLTQAIDGWTARFGCARLIAVSEYVRQNSHLRLGYPSERMEVIYNPIDLEDLQAGLGCDRSRLLREWGLPAESRILLHVGRISEEKGLIYAIRALPLVRQQFPAARLISAGHQANQQWLHRLQQEAADLGVAEFVRFLGARRDVPDLLRVCDVFLFPSLHEGLGIALIEAMALGCACIASRIAAVAEYMQHDVNGVFVPPGDSSRLAQAVCEVLADPARRGELGRAASTSVSERFRPQLAAERLAQLYESVLQPAGQRNSQPSVKPGTFSRHS
jgi:glycosyltransferase involved in cell wall biosynthesis